MAHFFSIFPNSPFPCCKGGGSGRGKFTPNVLRESIVCPPRLIVRNLSLLFLFWTCVSLYVYVSLFPFYGSFHFRKAFSQFRRIDHYIRMWRLFIYTPHWRYSTSDLINIFLHSAPLNGFLDVFKPVESFFFFSNRTTPPHVLHPHRQHRFSISAWWNKRRVAQIRNKWTHIGKGIL